MKDFNYRWRQSLSSARWFLNLPGHGRQICVFQSSDGSYGFNVCGQDQPGQWDSNADAMAAAESWLTAPLKVGALSMAELHWRRSNSTGNLFLRDTAQRSVGLVFKGPDGAYRWKRAGCQEESAPCDTEQDAIDALYAALGM